MHSLGDLIDRRPALAAGGHCEGALAAFVHDPDCRALAVVEGDRPIGVLHREAFLARMEAPGASDRPLPEAVEPDPLIADAGDDAAAFVARAMAERPLDLLGGFIVTRDGAYEGVCDLGRLLPALGEAAAPPESDLIERICAEVRTPVADALAAAGSLKRQRLPEGSAVLIETIAEAAESTLSLLDVAVELHRAEAGRLEIAPVARRLQELMDEIESSWRVAADTAGVTLLVSYDGAPDCAAMVDSGRVMQVFDALIGHAMAHSRRGVLEASLQVRPVSQGFTLVGKVRDNGASYDEGHLAGMFGSQGGLSPQGGMSLQLALVLAQKTMTAMGGALEARANPGPGATVSFELTVEAAEPAGAAEPEPQTVAGRSAHILVVDDNATNRMVVEALCEMFDCSTESVVDGVEAVEAAKAGRYDVILMDIKMPRMDGVTATREIRQLAGAAGRTPIIALTANADADEVAQYLAAGMLSVVEKPIKPERLMEALDNALTERTASPDAAAA